MNSILAGFLLAGLLLAFNAHAHLRGEDIAVSQSSSAAGRDSTLAFDESGPTTSFRSLSELTPWLQIDLGEGKAIDRLHIVLDTDNQINKLWVVLSDVSISGTRVSDLYKRKGVKGYLRSADDNHTVTLSPATRARFVYLVSGDTSHRVLSIADVSIESSLDSPMLPGGYDAVDRPDLDTDAPRISTANADSLPATPETHWVQVIYVVPANATYRNRESLMLDAHRQVQSQWSSWGWTFNVKDTVLRLEATEDCSYFNSFDRLRDWVGTRLGGYQSNIKYAVFAECSTGGGAAQAYQPGNLALYYAYVVDGIGLNDGSSRNLSDIGAIGHELGHNFGLMHETCDSTIGIGPMCNGGNWPNVYPHEGPPQNQWQIVRQSPHGCEWLQECSGSPDPASALTSVNSEKCLDIYAASQDAGANVQQYSCHGQANQNIRFSLLDNGAYELQMSHSAMCLDVAGNGTGNGTNVQQWPCNQTVAQQWRINPIANDVYELVGSQSNRCLTVESASQNNEANIEILDCSRTPNQQWRIDASVFDDIPPQVPSLSIADKTVAEDAGTAFVDISLDRAASAPISVTAFSRPDGTASKGIDFYGFSSQIRFAPGETEKRVAVEILDDRNNEPAETLSINLIAATGADIVDSKAILTITDNDDTAEKPLLSIDDASVNEADGQASISLRLSRAANEIVSVTVHTRRGSAQGGSDYYGFTQELQFTAGQTVKALPVIILDDTARESTEFLTLLAIRPVNVIIDDGVATLTINDND